MTAPTWDPGFPWTPLRDLPAWEDVAVEALLLPNDDGWWAPCGTPNPWPDRPGIRYERRMP